MDREYKPGAQSLTAGLGADPVGVGTPGKRTLVDAAYGGTSVYGKAPLARPPAGVIHPGRGARERRFPVDARAPIRRIDERSLPRGADADGIGTEPRGERLRAWLVFAIHGLWPHAERPSAVGLRVAPACVTPDGDGQHHSMISGSAWLGLGGLGVGALDVVGFVPGVVLGVGAGRLTVLAAEVSVSSGASVTTIDWRPGSMVASWVATWKPSSSARMWSCTPGVTWTVSGDRATVSGALPASIRTVAPGGFVAIVRVDEVGAAGACGVGATGGLDATCAVSGAGVDSERSDGAGLVGEASVACGVILVVCRSASLTAVIVTAAVRPSPIAASQRPRRARGAAASSASPTACPVVLRAGHDASPEPGLETANAYAPGDEGSPAPAKPGALTSDDSGGTGRARSGKRSASRRRSSTRPSRGAAAHPRSAAITSRAVR